MAEIEKEINSELEDELASLSALSNLLESEQMEDIPVPDQQEEITSEHQDLVHPALNRIDEKLRPDANVSCLKCPMANWYGNALVLKCYCKEMFAVIYDSDNPVDAVTYCDRLEMPDEE